MARLVGCAGGGCKYCLPRLPLASAAAVADHPPMTAAAVATLARALAEWVARPGNQKFLRDEQLPVIEQALADPGRQGQLPVACWLHGSWLLASGEVAVLDGRARGWDDVRHGLALLRTSLLLRLARHRQQPGRTGDEAPFPLLAAAHTVALGIALDDPDGEALFAAFAELPERAFAAGAAWPAFVRELVRLRAGARPTVTPRLGDYRDILLLWHGDGLPLLRALQAALDRQLERSRGKGAEFADPWVAVLPLVAMVVQAVRAELSLPTPKIEHPLMFTHLLTMPPPPGRWPPVPLAEAAMQLLQRRR